MLSLVVATVCATAAAPALAAEPASAPTDRPDHVPADERFTVSPTVDGGTGEPASAYRLRGANGTDSTAVDDDLESATGTVEVVVRLEDANLRPSTDETDAEATLEEHANATQEPLRTYAEETPGVDLETTFWLSNAVVLEIDAGAVDPSSFDRFENVTAIHENFEIDVPEPPDTETYRSDGGERNGEKLGAVDGDAVGGTTAPESGRPVTTGAISFIRVPTIWETYDTRGAGARVAVLDTGIDVDHPDLELHTDDPSDPTYPGGWAEFDGLGDRVEGSTPHDTGTHGTHVSGTVAGGNASGTSVGVAPEAELLHGLVLTEDGGTFAQLVAGMEWAVAEEADVISTSLGASGRHDRLIEPVTNAESAGVSVVAAVGNEGPETSGSPSNVYDAVAVGAVDESGAVPSFSGGDEINASEWTTAPETWPERYVVPTVVAPGVDVVSTVPGGGYEALPGTSMATPHVAGTVALLSTIDPDATPAEVRAALTETAWKPAGTPVASDTRYGAGIVDAAGAADRLADDRRNVSTRSETDARSSDRGFRSSEAVAGTVVLAVIVVATLVAATFERGGRGRDE
ncbi:S8 family serine peptidase [Natrialbaceae archaeon GCM10025810]|uniref:S8 family serine peptidase n=1 Tax=Halovalidus salilacus TaxID=3075124 RepID=UPI003622CD48